MSNPSTPYGFKDLGLIDGSEPNFGFVAGLIAANNTNKIYGGDVAKPIAAGVYDVFTAAVGGGAPIGGIFTTNFKWYSQAAGRLVYNSAWLGATGDLVANSQPSCGVLVHPNSVFQARSLGTSGGPVTASQVGSLVNFGLGSAPGNNQISAFGIDDATIGAGPALPFKIYGIVQAPESDPTSIYNEVLVIFNNESIQ